MNLMKTSRTFRTAASIVAVCGLAAATQAQPSDRERDGDRPFVVSNPPLESMEWIPGEGVVEEQWYDPTDWFDDDFDGVDGPDVDYDFDRFGQDPADGDEDYDDGYYDYTGEDYTPGDRARRAERRSRDGDSMGSISDWFGDVESDLYAEAYYDGYYDGFNDDEFGYDSSVAGDSDNDRYLQSYRDGYYDGYYDQSRSYSSDWTYYLYTFPIDTRNADRSERERADDDRERGDRAREMGTKGLKRSDAKKAAMNIEKQRVRGTVQRVERLKPDKLSDRYEGHMVLRLTMEDGRKVLADFGPKAEDMTISKGDMVSLQGARKKMDGRRVVDLSRIRVNDEVMWSARKNGMPSRSDS